MSPMERPRENESETSGFGQEDTFGATLNWLDFDLGYLSPSAEFNVNSQTPLLFNTENLEYAQPPFDSWFGDGAFDFDTLGIPADSSLYPPLLVTPTQLGFPQPASHPEIGDLALPLTCLTQPSRISEQQAESTYLESIRCSDPISNSKDLTLF